MSFYKSKFQKTTAQVMLGAAVLIGHTFAYGRDCRKKKIQFSC